VQQRKPIEHTIQAASTSDATLVIELYSYNIRIPQFRHIATQIVYLNLLPWITVTVEGRSTFGLSVE
jgi:hypothetical protein